LILIGTFEANSTVAFFASFSIVLSAGYSIWLYNRLMFGLFIIPYKVKEFWLKDLTYREFFILFICTFLVFLMGIYPNIFLSYLHISCTNVINYLF
jgi:NADH:ubiquinone oxidoreductase subunit 4 (subunit M)